MNAAAPRRPSRNPTLLACSATFLAASVMHVVVWWQYRADPFSTTYVADALSYHRWALRLIEGGLSAEFVAVDLREALDHLGEIVGAVVTDDLRNKIFDEFCIGK